MMPPIYKPPYDSPIEDEFARFAEKYLGGNINFTPQFEIKTICGLFRADFHALTTTGQSTVFECDGKDFHTDKNRDEWRDAMILGSGDVDELYRIRGSDITYHMEDVFYILSKWSPHLFDERQKYILERIASEEVLKIKISPEQIVARLTFWIDDLQVFNRIRIEKRHHIIPEGRRQYWVKVFNYAKDAGGGNLDRLINEYSNQK